jgi:hypothetical protein
MKKMDKILSLFCSLSIFVDSLASGYYRLVYLHSPMRKAIFTFGCFFYLVASFFLLLELFGNRFKSSSYNIWVLFFLCGLIVNCCGFLFPE